MIYTLGMIPRQTCVLQNWNICISSVHEVNEPFKIWYIPEPLPKHYIQVDFIFDDEQMRKVPGGNCGLSVLPQLVHNGFSV